MPTGKPKAKSKAVAVPNEQAALLAAIIAKPKDNTARLVYADWLQEHDDEEQAEFIRDSIKYATMPQKGKAWKELHNRLWERIAERRRTWLRPFGIESGAPHFERGLAE